MSTLWAWLRRIAPHWRAPQPPVKYAEITTSNRPPRNEDVKDDEFHLVVSNGRQLWALFRCPCGCGEVVTLSLQRVHRPHWVIGDRGKRPTLSPSVWRDRGCYSHFWVTDGRIYWAANTGAFPIWRRGQT